MKKTILIASLLLVAAAYFWIGRPAGPSEGPAEVPAREFQFAEATDRLLPAPASPADPAQTAGTSDGLNEDIRLGTVSVAFERLRKAAENPGSDRFADAFQFLVELLAEDSRALWQALDHFEREVDPTLLAAFARLIGPHLSRENRSDLFEAVLDLAENSESPEKRAAALTMFANIGNPTPDLLETVLRISREDPAVNVQLRAIQTIGQWAANHPRKWKQLSSELVKTIDASNDGLVRGHAIQAIALHSGIQEPEVLGAMDEYMKHDPSPQNRSIAALALGGATGELREPAVRLLEEAFAAEPNLDIQRNIVTQIARAGGKDAVFALAGLPTNDPILEQDVHDYLELLESGDLSFDEIFSQKFARDAERGTIVGASSHQD